MKRIVLTVFITFVVLPNIFGQYPITVEEYDVWAAILTKYDAKKVYFVIDNKTLKSRNTFDENEFKYPMSEFEPLLKNETVKDLNQKNSKEYLMERKLGLVGRYVLVEGGKVDQLFKSNVEIGWKNFYKKYPNSHGRFKFSRVGFDTAKSQAMVICYESRGSLWMEGKFFLLVKKDGKWVVEKDFLFIAS